MSRHVQSTAQTASELLAVSVRPPVLQRRCACGASAGPEGTCAECAGKQRLGGGAAVALGQPDDRHEAEADRVADQVMTGSAPDVQRMEDGEEEEGAVQRKAAGPAEPGSAAVLSAAKAVTAGGQPLPSAERAYFEPRFGRDLGHVRLHTGPTAQTAARAIHARAYTLRNSIAFAPGAYAPATPHGRRLLAHELVHTIQQGAASGPAQGTIRRKAAVTNEPTKGSSFGGFFRNIGRAFADFFTGSEPAYDDEVLKNYLETMEKQNAIEGDYDSDNKARAVVAKKMHEGKPVGVRILLIREMLSGFTGDDDEQAILTILRGATKADRKTMADRVGLEELYDNIHGDELGELYAMFPLLASLHPRGEKEHKTHSLDEYIKKWETEHGRVMTPEERKTLARGCIGITALELGTLGNPDLSNCYETFAEAWKAKEKMAEFLVANFPDRKALIFSKRFWSDNKYPRDPKTGKVDMSSYDYSARPGGYTNFDYGLYDEKTGKWWHANHCDTTLLSRPQCGGEMEVYESNLQYYSRGLLDFNRQVFCVGVAVVP